MLPVLCLALGAYWGPGFEDLSLGRRVSVGLRGQAVDADVQTAIGKDDPQTFDWLAYYEVGGLMRAMANTEQFDPEPLLSGKPRVDAVQQGYFMIYNATTLADFDMKDHFFSITLDLAKHTEYEAHGVAPNCTLRFVVFESEPNVVSVKGSNIVLDGSFVGEEDAAKYQDGAGAFNRVLRSTEELEQHFSLTWGFETDPATGAPRAPCRKAVDQLWIGVQCIRGYATEPCTPLGTTATKYDDCNTYCPYTLTARAVPRALKHGDAVESLIGPGQWQLFEVDAGKYDLVEVTIERDEFDEATYPYAWQDGLTGGAWLAHRTCVQPNVTRRKSDLECQLFGICGPDDALEPFICPYGHPQAVDNPLCSPELNVTYEVAVANGSWVRAATVDPHSGELDDLGYSDNLARIAAAEEALEAEMHYPTQLEIRAEIATLQENASRLANSGDTRWKRRWKLRLCSGPEDAGTYVLALYASHAMARSYHGGRFTMRATRIEFDRSPLATGVPRRGCLKRREGEVSRVVFALTPPEATLSSLQLVEARPYWAMENTNHITRLSARRGAPPTEAAYDAQVVYPSLRLAASTCDAAQATADWMIAVELSPDHSVSEVYFELEASIENTALSLGDTVAGFGCCGQYKYYVFDDVPEDVAPVAELNVSSGELKALYWKYEACPNEALDVVGEECRGWCVVAWFQRFTGNLGRAKYEYYGDLPVPAGVGSDPDKRRGGQWFLGIQALEQPVQFTVTTRATYPKRVGSKDGCNRLDRHCPTKWEDVIDSAAPPRAAASTRAALLAATLVLARLGIRC